MNKMKNKSAVTIAFVVMLVIVGVISVMSVRVAERNQSKWVISMGGTVELRNTIELPADKVAELEVRYTSRNIQLYPTTGDKIVIKEYLITDEEEGKAEVTYEEIPGEEAGRKKVTVAGNQDKVITVFGFAGGNERIEIYLPVSGLNRLTLSVKSGSITALDDFAIELDELNVVAKSGNIRWQATKAERAKFEAKSGTIRLKGVEAKLAVETGSGSINVEDVVGDMAIAAGSGTVKVLDAVGAIAVATGSGSVTVEDLEGCGSVAVGSGTMKVAFEKVTGDVELAAGSGSIRLTLPEELSFEFEGKTTSGSLDTTFDECLRFNKDGKEASGTVGSMPTCKIEVETKSGNVDITAD